MLALSPDTIEVQMFGKIAAVAALCLPTFVQAEVVEFNCRSDSSLSPTRLAFDTVSQKVKFGNWPLSVAERWGENEIVWAAFAGQASAQSAAIFMFRRATSELISSVIYQNSDWDLAPRTVQDTFQCSRPF